MASNNWQHKWARYLVPPGRWVPHSDSTSPSLLRGFLPAFPPPLQVPASITVGSTFAVTFTTTVATPIGIFPRERFRVVLVHPGFSTHSMRHGMRNVFLSIVTAAVGLGLGY